MKFHTTRILSRYARIFGAGLIISLLIPVIAFSQSPAKVNLLSAGNFEILASTTITSSGFTVIKGDIGLSPGTSVTGFPPGVVTGTKHITDPIAAQGQLDLTTAYNDAAGRTLNPITKSGNIGGQTLAPGLYKSTSSLAISSGDLTLDAQGDANAVWIFQIASTLTTTSGRQVVLAGGAQAKNIFWQVGSSATLGTGSVFYGNILANISITLTTSTTMVGRSLARTGAVTCGAYGGTHPDSLKANTPIFTTASRNVDLGGTHVDSAKWMVISISNTGTADLNITAATSTNPKFTSHLSSSVVKPGGTINDTVKFLPTTMGADSGKLIFLNNSATSPDTIAVHGRGGEAILFSASRNINVGSTHVDSTLWTLITLSNTGNDTLRFTSATSSDSAFTSHLSSLFIAPGASIIDSVKFLPTKMGADTSKLIFAGNAATAPDTIIVRGKGVAPILTTTSRSVNIGSTHVGIPKWALITITNTGNDTLRFATPTSSNFAFSSHLSALKIAPGASVIDSVMFLPTTMGQDASKLVFAGNGTTSPDTISVFGVGTAAVFFTSSRTVNVGTTQTGTPTWTIITLSNTGNDTLHLTSATSTNSVFSSHLSGMAIAPGESIIDTIKFLPTTVGENDGQLMFTSDAATSPDVIAVYGNGVNIVKAAILAISTRNVNCGSTQVGKTTSTVITLVNTGNDTLRIATASGTNTVFSSHLSGLVIAPGAIIFDTIKFTPTTVGAHAGKLLFSTNAVNSPDTIGVFGAGTQPVAVNEGASPASYSLGAMYPNPVSDATQLQVRLQSGERLLHAAMYDMLGRELQDWTSRIAPSGSLALHLGSYPVGEYIVRLLTTARMQVLPVVIVK